MELNYVTIVQITVANVAARLRLGAAAQLFLTAATPVTDTTMKRSMHPVYMRIASLKTRELLLETTPTPIVLSATSKD